MNKYKKGISPLITTILLIVVTVILIAVVLNWGKVLANNSLKEASNIKEISSSEAGNFIYPGTFIGGAIQFTYKPSSNLANKDITITSYKIFTDDNQTIDVNLSENYMLVNGQNAINLTDFSELNITNKKINIQFNLSDGGHIMLKNIINTPTIETESIATLELPYVMNGEVKLYIHPTNNSTGIEWGCFGTSIPGAQSTTDGSSNTSAILAACATRPIAASICDDLTFEGYSDWYLPTTGQFSAIWNACTGTKTYACMNAAINKGAYESSWVDLTNTFYWTSKEYSSFFAEIFYTDNGTNYTVQKNYDTYYVRCVHDP